MKVAQSGFEGGGGISGQRRIDDLRYTLQRSQKHLNTTRTIGQEACGIGKVLSLRSNLNGHVGTTFQCELSLASGASDVRVDAINKKIETKANQKH